MCGVFDFDVFSFVAGGGKFSIKGNITHSDVKWQCDGLCFQNPGSCFQNLVYPLFFKSRSKNYRNICKGSGALTDYIFKCCHCICFFQSGPIY